MLNNLKSTWLTPIIVFFYRYRIFKKICWKLASFLEGGELNSLSMRKILIQYFGVEVGAYSYGTCMVPGAFPSGVNIGTYCSIAAEVKIFLRNHPYQRLSMHPYFYNSKLGYTDKDTIENGKLNIGNDVWIGHGAIITPSCESIGDGAVIGAGSVVTKDVPKFSIIAGNPAKFIKYRFDREIIEKIKELEWWDKSINELLPHYEIFLLHLNTSELEIKNELDKLFLRK